MADRPWPTTFLVTWLAFVISWVGSGLTGFALGVVLYQRTGSVTVYSLVSTAALLPTIALAPLVGPWIDRHDRRMVLLLGQLGHGACTLGLAALAWTGRIEPVSAVLLTGLGACFKAVELPALTAASTLLVAPHQLGRASGMLHLGLSFAQLVGPVAAGALLGPWGLEGILLLDTASFVGAAAVLLSVRFPRPAASEPESAVGRREALLFGWRYIGQRPGLLRLLGFMAFCNLCLGMVFVLVTPLLLGFTDASTLGAVLSIGGLGMLAGSLLMAVWGGPRQQVPGILGAVALQGVMLLLAAARPSVVLAAVGGFGVLFAMPLSAGCNQALWQRKVDPAVQGRVFTVRIFLAQLTLPAAYLLAGPLADGLFEPALRAGGPLASSLGPLLGVGPGRGIALLFVVLGLLLLCGAALAWYDPRVRRLQIELPDALARPDALTEDRHGTG